MVGIHASIRLVVSNPTNILSKLTPMTFDDDNENMT